MAGDAHGLEVVVVVWPLLAEGDDVIDFQISFWVRLIATAAGEVITGQDTHAACLSTFSTKQVGLACEWGAVFQAGYFDCGVDGI